MNSNSNHGAAPPFDNPLYSSHAPDGFPPTLDTGFGQAVLGGDNKSNRSSPTHGYPVPSHVVNNVRSEKQAGQILQSTQHDWPEEHHQLDALDQEMLAEAHENGDYDQQAQLPHEEGDTELEKSLAWIPKSQGRPVPRSSTPLPVSRILLSHLTRTKNLQKFSFQW